MYKSGKILKNKAWELEIYKVDRALTEMDILFDITTKTDHAGLRLNIDIWKLSFNFSFYDTRHWNEESNSWQDYSLDQNIHQEEVEKKLIKDLINSVVRK